MAKENAVLDVMQTPVVTNTSDDANVLSVTTIAPLPDRADGLVKTEKELREEPELPEPEKEKKEEEAKPPEETPPEKVEPKVPEAVQKRINEAIKRQRTAERERDYERTKRLEMEKELVSARLALPPDIKKPKIEDFETMEEYNEALTDYKIDLRFWRENQKKAREHESVEEKENLDESYGSLEKKIEKGRRKFTDFDELVLNDDLKISEEMVEAIILSDAAEDVLYYLGQHPDESQEISGLTSVQAAYRLGKIEEKLHAPPPPKKTTKAPEPISPISSSGAVELDPNKMTPREYREARESGRIR